MSVQNPGLSYSSQRPKINGRQITLTSKTAASPVKSNAASFLSNTSRSSIFTPALRSNTFAMYSNRMDYTQLRNSLNANIHYVPRVNVNGTPMYVQNNELGPMDKLALAMTAIKGAGTITKELLGLAMDIKSSGTSKTGNSAISTLNKLNSDVKANSAAPANKTTAASNNSAAASSISDMKGADNSTDLRSAIESAKEKQMELSQQRAQIHGSLDSLKAEAEKAETAIKDLNTKIDSKKKDVSEKENDVNQKESNLRSTEKDKDSKLQTLKNMEAAVGQAATDYTNACEALTSAEATLASTPEYITNPDGTKVKNPAYDTAKKAVETAEQNKAKAKEALDKAKADKEKAVENYEKVCQDYETASKNYITAKQEYETAKGELEKLQEELNQLNAQKKEKEGVVKKYEDAVKQNEQLTSDIGDLGKEITSQETRLKTLEEKEKKEFNDNSTQMNELADKIHTRNEKIDSTDGMNVRENIRNRKNVKNSEQYDRLADKQAALEDKVGYTECYQKGQVENLGGKKFRTYSYKGKTYYMIGSKPATQEEYDKAIKNAKIDMGSHYTSEVVVTAKRKV